MEWSPPPLPAFPAPAVFDEAFELEEDWEPEKSAPPPAELMLDVELAEDDLPLGAGAGAEARNMRLRLTVELICAKLET